MAPPSRYSAELASYICEQMAGGRLSTAVCQELGLPKETIGEWRAKYPEFRTKYIEAFMARCFGMGEEAIAVLDAVPKGSPMPDVQIAIRKAELLKFFASRIVPQLREPMPSFGEGSVILVLPSNGREMPLIEGSVEAVDE
jgi:hypothetical protein